MLLFFSLIGPLACCGPFNDTYLVWPTTEENQTVTLSCPVQDFHGIIQGPLKIWTEHSLDLNFLKFALRGKDPRTLGVDFLDHNLL